MRILVTGGAGFIGSHIVQHFSERGDTDIRVLDNFRTGRRENLEDFRVDLREGSVTDAHLVNDAVRGVDHIFHLAAMVSVPESMQHPDECVRINTIGTLNVLMAAREHGVRKVVFSSTCAIYGSDPALPKVETMLPRPQSPYAVTKLDGEHYLDIFRTELGLPTASMRYFNVFGPRQDPGSPYAAAIPIFVSKALRNEDIRIYGDGEQTRDFIFVKDVVRANVMLMSAGEGVCNIGTGSRITVNQLATRIVAMTGSRSKIVHVDERPGEVRHSLADIGRARALGFEPEAEFDAALAETVRYFQGRQAAAARG